MKKFTNPFLSVWLLGGCIVIGVRLAPIFISEKIS
jgi:hypothetical protein